jgi:hypothetical protein
MARRPKNTITISITLPERLLDGSYLPSDPSFREFARIHLEDHALDFLRNSQLGRLREDFQREWREQMGVDADEAEKRDSEEQGKRKEGVATRKKEVVAAAIAKVPGRVPISSGPTKLGPPKNQIQPRRLAERAAPDPKGESPTVPQCEPLASANEASPAQDDESRAGAQSNEPSSTTAREDPK